MVVDIVSEVSLQNRPVTGSRQIIRDSLAEHRPDLLQDELERRSVVIFQDVILLARCAATKCLVTYGDAIALRGHGNAQNGQWLDETYAHAIAPLGFPDLTMLVVNRATKQPSPDAFDARRTKLSKVRVDDVGTEQKRCIWFPDYESLLGTLVPIPADKQLVKILTPEPAKEREIARAVRNAIGRVRVAGLAKTVMGREYPDSLPIAELLTLGSNLWEQQNGRCALSRRPFDIRSDDDGGIQDDRVSLDRIDNRFGYFASNVQLVTQFANRARGVMSCEEAKARLCQFD